MQNKRPLIGLTPYRVKVEGRDAIVDGLMPTYTNAVLKAGGIPVLIPLTLQEADLKELRQRLDGILIPGGGDIDPIFYGGDSHGKIYGVTRERDIAEIYLAQAAVAHDQPLLAICRGHQVLNVALGGTLWEDVLDMMPNGIKHAYFRDAPRNHTPHAVELCAGSKLAELLGPGKSKPVNSLHHQGIKVLGRDLVPTAYAPDGLIEGIELPDHRFAVGVQWHPEEMVEDDDAMLDLFKAFVAACR